MIRTNKVIDISIVDSSPGNWRCKCNGKDSGKQDKDIHFTKTQRSMPFSIIEENEFQIQILFNFRYFSSTQIGKLRPIENVGLFLACLRINYY
mmetsp:Transcript_18654/g.44890  ORF Transcript_18654/g.44890 Transcript_18654/m.44890 type:complete len:93 (-) Transcript_18654:1256-1534(-)